MASSASSPSTSPTFPPIPPILKPVSSCMKIACDVDKTDPVVAYWCRFYVVQAGLKLDKKSKESITFLTSVMDWLEKDKKMRQDNESITNEMAAQAHVENYALRLFDKADNEDRVGNANKSTIRLFLYASIIFDVLSVFGEVPEEITRRSKYAKWKATYINKCLKSGETPVPGPMEGTDAEEFGAYGNDGGELGGTQSQNQYGDQQSNEHNDNSSAGAFNMPSSNFPPAAPSHSHSMPPQPSSPSCSHAPGASVITASNGASLGPEDLVRAAKFCKFAGSALQYEDVPNAIENLEKALKLLKTGSENN